MGSKNNTALSSDHAVLGNEVATRINTYIGQELRPEDLLRKYYRGSLGDDGARSYTGSLFDEVLSPDPNRITTEDVAAVALLSVPLKGQAVQRLLWDQADEISALLKQVPFTALHQVESLDALEPVWKLQAHFDRNVRGVDLGPVRRSKLLAHKRPHLIPIRDRYVLKALVGREGGQFTVPQWAALRSDASIPDRLDELRRSIQRPDLSLLRILDVVVWMTEIGKSQVSD